MVVTGAAVVSADFDGAPVVSDMGAAEVALTTGSVVVDAVALAVLVAAAAIDVGFAVAPAGWLLVALEPQATIVNAQAATAMLRRADGPREKFMSVMVGFSRCEVIGQRIDVGSLPNSHPGVSSSTTNV